MASILTQNQLKNNPHIPYLISCVHRAVAKRALCRVAVESVCRLSICRCLLLVPLLCLWGMLLLLLLLLSCSWRGCGISGVVRGGLLGRPGRGGSTFRPRLWGIIHWARRASWLAGTIEGLAWVGASHLGESLLGCGSKTEGIPELLKNTLYDNQNDGLFGGSGSEWIYDTASCDYYAKSYNALCWEIATVVFKIHVNKIWYWYPRDDLL